MTEARPVGRPDKQTIGNGRRGSDPAGSPLRLIHQDDRQVSSLERANVKNGEARVVGIDD